MRNPMTLITLRRAVGATVLVAAAVLTGCAQVPLGAPVASVDNIQKAKSIGKAPVNLGEFALAAGKDPKLDQSLAIRGATVVSSYDASFAKHLRETLRVELQAAGLLDPASATTIRGFLTASQADAAISQGSGSVAARFIVVRAGKTMYDKELKADATWESSFVGATAIPAAINEYSALYRKLVGLLLADPAFRAAVLP
jgi:hypothetical protein